MTPTADPAHLPAGGICLPVEHYGLWGGGMPKAAYLLAHAMRQLGLPVTVITLHTTPADIAASRACGIRVVQMPWRWGHRWRLPQTALALTSVIDALCHPRRLLIAVGSDPLAGLLLATPIAGRLAVWECTEATPDNPFVDRAALKRLARALAVLAPSAAIEANIRQHHRYAGPLVRLPFWTEAEPASSAPASPPQPPSDFLYLGRKDAKKGLYELIGALARLERAAHPATLHLCGPGDDAPFRQFAAEQGVAHRLRCSYFAERRDVGAALRACRWLVLPSHHEGYPLTLLEAFDQGRPVIATLVGSVPEMCGASRAAMLVPSHDEAALAAALQRALDMPSDDYQARSAAARALFQHLSGPDRVHQQLRTALATLDALRTRTDHHG